MTRAEPSSLRLNLALAALIAVLAIVSLMVGPAALSPREALAGLFGGDGAAGDRRARHPAAAHRCSRS